MYDIDNPKFIFVSLLEEFIRETEHSLAYFFALLVFLLTFLLALFGRDVLYTGLIGVLCLLLIKMRDFIDGFKALPLLKPSCPPVSADILPRSADRTVRLNQDGREFQTAFDDAAITLMADEFPTRFNNARPISAENRASLLSYLQTCLKIVETVSVFFPERPLQPQTRQALKRMVISAQKYMVRRLETKYRLEKEQVKQILRHCFTPKTNDTLFEKQLESYGLNPMAAHGTTKIIEILRKISRLADSADKAEKKPA